MEGAPVEIRRVAADDWALLRTVRLAALEEAPTAFGSTLAREADLGDDVWRRRAAEGAEAVRSVTFLAERDGDVVGLVIGVRDVAGEGTSGLYSLWVAPSARGRGVAAALVGAVVDWARAAGSRRLVLDVTEHNEAALSLYARLGFRSTGRSKPWPSQAGLREIELVLELGGTTPSADAR